MADDVNDLGYAQTPGKMLQTAREERHLSIDAIAAKLRLSVQRVQELENDDYHNDVEFFIRAHLRAYARIVGIPEPEILQSFEALGYKKQPSSMESLSLQPASMPHIAHAHKIRHLLLWLTAIVMIVFVLLVIIWWQGQAKSSILAVTKPSLVKQTSTPASQSATAPISQPVSQPQPQPQFQPQPQSSVTQEQTEQNIVVNKPESEADKAKPEIGMPKSAPIVSKPEPVITKAKIKSKHHSLYARAHNKQVLKANYKIIPVPTHER